MSSENGRNIAGGFVAEVERSERYGALAQRLLDPRGSEPRDAAALAVAREAAGAALVEAWWLRRVRALRAKHSKREALIAIAAFIGGFVAAGLLVWFGRRSGRSA